MMRNVFEDGLERITNLPMEIRRILEYYHVVNDKSSELEKGLEDAMRGYIGIVKSKAGDVADVDRRAAKSNIPTLGKIQEMSKTVNQLVDQKVQALSFAMELLDSHIRKFEEDRIIIRDELIQKGDLTEDDDLQDSDMYSYTQPPAPTPSYNNLNASRVKSSGNTIQRSISYAQTPQPDQDAEYPPFSAPALTPFQQSSSFLSSSKFSRPSKRALEEDAPTFPPTMAATPIASILPHGGFSSTPSFSSNLKNSNQSLSQLLNSSTANLAALAAPGRDDFGRIHSSSSTSGVSVDPLSTEVSRKLEVMASGMVKKSAATSTAQTTQEVVESSPYCLCLKHTGQDDLMIGCDNEACERQWFHLACVGLTEPPPEDAKWFCPPCSEGDGKSKKKKGR